MVEVRVVCACERSRLSGQLEEGDEEADGTVMDGPC